jgi:hypothetical protein
LIGLVRHSLSNAHHMGETWSSFLQRLESVVDSRQSASSTNRGALSAAASWFFGLVRGGWLTLESRVARPLVLQAVQRRHALSAFAVVLLLARWKERRRRWLMDHPQRKVHQSRSSASRRRSASALELAFGT